MGGIRRTLLTLVAGLLLLPVAHAQAQPSGKSDAGTAAAAAALADIFSKVGDQFYEDCGPWDDITYNRIATIIAYGELRARIEQAIDAKIDEMEAA